MEWDRPTNRRPIVILHENAKEILIACTTTCVVTLLIFLGVHILVDRFDDHIESMHKMGYSVKPIYDEKGDYRTSAWVKGDGPTVVYRDGELTHDNCVNFLKKELGIEKEG